MYYLFDICFVQARRWLDNPGQDDEKQGLICTRNIIGEARKIAQSVQDDQTREAITNKAAECERLCNELDQLVKAGQGDSPKVCQKFII